MYSFGESGHLGNCFEVNSKGREQLRIERACITVNIILGFLLPAFTQNLEYPENEILPTDVQSNLVHNNYNFYYLLCTYKIYYNSIPFMMGRVCVMINEGSQMQCLQRDCTVYIHLPRLYIHLPRLYIHLPRLCIHLYIIVYLYCIFVYLYTVYSIYICPFA